MTPQMQRNRELIEAFQGRRVIVLGDVMLDEFTWGQVSRISPEAPVPVVEVLGDTYRPGGSANVSANIRSLGGQPMTVAVIGRDNPGRRLLSLFENEGLDASLLVQDDRRTTQKTRIIAHNQQVVRADREDRTPLSATTRQALISAFMVALGKAQAVVVSDYDKGVVSRNLLEAVLPAAREAGVPTFLDPKVHHAEYYKPCTVITPNTPEAELLAGCAIRDRKSLEEAGQLLLSRFDCEWVLVTRGKDGMSLFSNSEIHHMSAAAREVFDVSGAGDTVIATLALAHAGGATLLEAARLANHAAGIVVGKIGTAVVTRAELKELLDRVEG